MPSNMLDTAQEIIAHVKETQPAWKYGVTPQELRIATILKAGGDKRTLKAYGELMLELGLIKKEADGYTLK